MEEFFEEPELPLAELEEEEEEFFEEEIPLS